MATQKELLNDVVIIRPLAIILLVIWHSFIIYAGGWAEPQGFQPIDAYWWIGKFSYAFMLELFVFISGYVFQYSLQRKNYTFKDVLISKFERLIIPSILFSIAYVLIFNNPGVNILGSVYSVLNGAGHMWFLPMLFWVTIIGFCLYKSKLNKKLLFAISLCLPAISWLPLPLRISSALYYILFFYLGMIVFRNRQSIIAKFSTSKYSITFALIFLVTFLLGLLYEATIKPQIALSTSVLVRGIGTVVGKYIRIAYALCGVSFIYIFVNYLLSVKHLILPEWIKSLNNACFGIYLFQQFILKILYYKTSLPLFVGPYLLPWVGLIVALIGSYLLTVLMRSTKLGRKLL